MDERNLALAILWRGRGAPMQAETVAERAALVDGDDGSDLRDALAALAEEALAAETPDGWQLAEPAHEVARVAYKALMREQFNGTLTEYDDSDAYRCYNRQVYGWGRFSFNMIDGPQRQLLLEVCGLGPGQRFVDLGCATGALTSWVAEETGAEGLGVDFAPRAIERARASFPAVGFEVGDLDDLQLPGASFDVALALDTLYFPEDLGATLRQVFAALKPSGRLVAFYSATAAPGARGEGLAFEDTKLGVALAKGGRAASSLHDVTDGASRVWRNARAAVDRLELPFATEGRRDLWVQRDQEVRGQLALVDEGRKRRWLVVVPSQLAT